VPAFVEWMTQDAAAHNAAALPQTATAGCSGFNQSNGRLYRLGTANGLVEPSPHCATSGDGSHNFGRVLAAADRLWILDVTGSRVIALRPDTFQIVSEGRARLADRYCVRQDVALYARRDRLPHVRGRRQSDWRAVPRGPAASARDRRRYGCRAGVDLSLDACARGFLRYRAADGVFDSEIGVFEGVAPDFLPRLLAVDASGQFVRLGRIGGRGTSSRRTAGMSARCGPANTALGFERSPSTRDGDLVMSSPQGIARFSRQTGAAGNAGVFYTACSTTDSRSTR
jgi:hypothetical protein